MMRSSTQKKHPSGTNATDAQLLVLASLEDGPKHGHAMRKRIEAAYKKKLGPGALYGAIDRLSMKGWIVPLPTDGVRKPYEITEAGREALRQSLATIRLVADESTNDSSETPSYYERVPEDLTTAELANEPKRPEATDRDKFPFTQLGGRRFEILAYLLTQRDSDDGEVVSLVKGSGDQGRDVLVHKAGRLKTVIQCKNLGNRLSLPSLQEELLKLVLHDFREHFISDEGITYELWVPNGWSEDADKLITGGLLDFSKHDWEEIFTRVTKKYAKLSSLQWNEVRAYVSASFANHIRIVPYPAIRITERLTAHSTLCEQFFVVQLVMKKEEIEAVVFSKTQSIETKLDRLTAAAEESATDDIDIEINEIRELINAGNRDEAKMRILYLRRNKAHKFSDRQEFRVLSNEGVIDCAENRPGDAAQKFLRAAKLQPDDTRAKENEVLAYYLRRDLEKTHELATARRTELPKSARIAGLWINSAPNDTPVANLENALDPFLLEQHEVAIALARRWMAAHNLERAEALIEAGKLSEPNWGQPWNLTAQIALGKVFEENAGMRQIAPADRKLILKTGIEAATKGLELSEKEGAWEKAEALAARSQLHLINNQLTEAAADAKQAYLLQNDDVGVLLTIAQTSISAGALDQAIDFLSEAYQKEPRSDVALSYSRALAQRNKDGDSQKAAEVIVSLDIASVPHLFKSIVGMQAIVTLSELADWDRAEDYLNRADAVLDRAEALTLRAGLEHRKGNDAEAERIAKEALGQLTDKTLALTKELLAQLFVNVGNPALALNLFQELFDKRIPTFNPRQLLMCAYRLDDHDRILKACEELHRRASMPWDVLELEIQILEQYNVKTAIERLQVFLADHPGHKLARLRLSAIAALQNLPEFIHSSLNELPTVEELPIEYVMPAVGILKLGKDADKAIDYAYRYLRLHFDLKEAHEAYIQTVISRADREASPDLDLVVPGAAVYIEEKYSGQPRWFVLEDTDVPVRDFEEITLKDPKAVALMGKKVGDSVVLVTASMANREGTIKRILPKYVRRFQDCITEIDMRFGPSSMIQSVPMGNETDLTQPGIVTLMTTVRERAEFIGRMRKIYTEQPLSTLHLYGAALSRNSYESIHDLAVSNEMPIKCASGDPLETNLALAMLEERPGLLLDLTAIATIRLLGLEWIFGTKTHRFSMTQGTWEELRNTLITPNISPGRSATITYEAGGYAMNETDKAAEEVRREENSAFLDSLQSNVEIIPATALAALGAETRKALIGYLGQYGAETVAVAPGSNLVIWSDDLMEGATAQQLLGGKRVWTQVVLISLVDAGVLPKDEYTNAAAKLIGMGYTSTFFDAGCVMESARLAEYRAGRFPLKQMIEVFSTNQTPQIIVKIFFEFFIMLQRQPLLYQQKFQITGAFLDALWSNPQTHPLVPALGKIGARFFGLNVVAEGEFNAALAEWYKSLSNRRIDSNSSPGN